jgi:hypothetical protein
VRLEFDLGVRDLGWESVRLILAAVWVWVWQGVSVFLLTRKREREREVERVPLV